MAAKFRDIVDLDRLIHETARLMIVTILHTVEEADFTYLMRETGLTKGNLSSHLTKSHLTKLEEAGYIQIEKTYKGRVPLTICKMTAAGRQAFAAYREAIRRMVLGPEDATVLYTGGADQSDRAVPE